MFRKIILFTVASIFSLHFVSCSDDPSSLGSALLNQDLVGLDSLDSYKDTLAQNSSTYKFITPQAASQVLLLGKAVSNGITNEAYTLLSFNIGFADTTKNYVLSKNLKIKSATIEMDVNYKIGSPLPGFSFTGHKINSGWTAAGFTTDSLATLNYDNANSILPSTLAFTKSDSVMKFNIDTALVSNWFTAEADPNIPSDNGIILVPQSSTAGIFGFHSLSSNYTNNVPLLSVVVTKDGWTQDDTLLFVPAVDLSVVKGTLPSSTEYMYLQTSVMLNSILKFDISKLPEHAIINYAQLELTIDTTESFVGNNYTNAVLASTFSSTTNPDTSVTSTVSLSRIGNTFKGNIAGFVQKWLNSKENNGVLLRTADIDLGIERFAIKSSTASDPLVRPRLKIIFTNKK